MYILYVCIYEPLGWVHVRTCTCTCIWVILTFPEELIDSFCSSDAESSEILAHQLNIFVDGVRLVTRYHVLGPN